MWGSEGVGVTLESCSLLHGMSGSLKFLFRGKETSWAMFGDKISSNTMCVCVCVYIYIYLYGGGGGCVCTGGVCVWGGGGLAAFTPPSFP